MENIIKAAVERGASDIHVKAGDVFRARIDGKLQPLTKQRLTPDQTRSIAENLISSEDVLADFDNLKDYDCTWGAPGIGRFRVNILRQRSSFMVVLRVIPFEIQPLLKLHVPESVQELAERPSGLLLVAGAGSTATADVMAGVIHHINSSFEKHIVTLESPIEFLHRDINASVTQREIGTDTDDVATGLKATLRQDPDVIMLGRALDHATAETALEAAESGLLVVARVAATDVSGAVSRLVAAFPPAEAAIARVRVVDALVGVVAVRKLARIDETGRATVAEVLVSTGVAQELLRDGAGPVEIREYLEAHNDDFGMRSFRQHAAELVSAGVISEDAAEVFGAAGDEA